MVTFTFYPEGQTCVAKSFEQIELVISLALSTKSTNKILAMNVLRNVAFHQNNRAVLLSSGNYYYFFCIQTRLALPYKLNFYLSLWSIKRYKLFFYIMTLPYQVTKNRFILTLIL